MKFDRPDEGQDARHAVGDAGELQFEPLATIASVIDAPLELRLVFGCQRSLLAKPDRLGLIPLHADPEHIEEAFARRGVCINGLL